MVKWSIIFYLLLSLIVLFSILDVLLTFEVLRLAAEHNVEIGELNPVAHILGFNVWLKLGLPLVYCVLALILYRHPDARTAVTITTYIVVSALALVCYWNLLFYLKLAGNL